MCSPGGSPRSCTREGVTGAPSQHPDPRSPPRDAHSSARSSPFPPFPSLIHNSSMLRRGCVGPDTLPPPGSGTSAGAQTPCSSVRGSWHQLGHGLWVSMGRICSGGRHAAFLTPKQALIPPSAHRQVRRGPKSAHVSLELARSKWGWLPLCQSYLLMSFTHLLQSKQTKLLFY